MKERTKLEELKELGWGIDEIVQLLNELKEMQKGVDVEQTSYTTGKSLKKRIVNLLDELGVPYGINGRDYILDSVEYLMIHKNVAITKELYPFIAEKWDTIPSRVERAIRQVKDRTISTDNRITNKIFKNISMNSRRSIGNSRFLYGLVSYLRSEDLK